MESRFLQVSNDEMKNSERSSLLLVSQAFISEVDEAMVIGWYMLILVQLTAVSNARDFRRKESVVELFGGV